MNPKVICFFAIIAAVYSAPQAALYPAGVSPALCPGYPNCDNSLLHGAAPVPATTVVYTTNPTIYPAGVSPALCPGYPNCDNSLLHGTAPVPAAPVVYTSSPVWNQPAIVVPSNNQIDTGAYIYRQYSPNEITGEGGNKYPAGVNPAACPNYPYCNTGANFVASVPVAVPLEGFSERQYPAGFNAATCPNYPYCA